ncbi:uncharacterized protein LAESUDRAFT_559399 [Laetiporus sulphureus 93-53]|uniref:NAD(P)-binding protein n=1 Tax=Laetiporus sulphureus 93-53 TaxID=1314785 RepID=A0A165B609_9APHY|nr:uncharacterized protein LAESUDRAFT_559399 [Laetiporus sulphureus 93-53]KZT00318.1 hypothetical protein LAESUDRAFT_559399 [Laetiporus sulphureus 93-53]
MMDLGLNEVHLVTDASGGIGLVICEIFLKQGARVTAHYNTNVTSLEPLLAEYGPSRIRTIQADLSDEDDVILMFIKEDEEFGSVQVLVVNVTVSEMTLEQ